jgi:thioredoxin 1
MSILHADGQRIFKEIETSNKVLIYCWAPWCPPCRMIAPILEEIHQEFELKIVKVNADENEDFISKFQVLGIPTILLFQEGQIVERITGFQPKTVLIDLFKIHEFVV